MLLMMETGPDPEYDPLFRRPMMPPKRDDPHEPCPTSKHSTPSKPSRRSPSTSFIPQHPIKQPLPLPSTTPQLTPPSPSLSPSTSPPPPLTPQLPSPPNTHTMCTPTAFLTSSVQVMVEFRLCNGTPKWIASLFGCCDFLFSFLFFYSFPSKINILQ